MTHLPKINSETFARGSKALREEIEETLEEIDDTFLAFFFSLIPERGRKLQGRFRTFQRMYGRKKTFSDFVHFVINRHSFERAFLPSGCKRPRQPGIKDLIERMRSTLKKPSLRVGEKPGKTIPDIELREAGLLEIHFGRGDTYKLVQKLCCQECSISRCAHKPL